MGRTGVTVPRRSGKLKIKVSISIGRLDNLNPHWRQHMQTETLSKRQNTEKNAQRRSWCKPDLIDYGTVGDLTQGGGSIGLPESVVYTSAAG